MNIKTYCNALFAIINSISGLSSVWFFDFLLYLFMLDWISLIIFVFLSWFFIWHYSFFNHALIPNPNPFIGLFLPTRSYSRVPQWFWSASGWFFANWYTLISYRYLYYRQPKLSTDIASHLVNLLWHSFVVQPSIFLFIDFMYMFLKTVAPIQISSQQSLVADFSIRSSKRERSFSLIVVSSLRSWLSYTVSYLLTSRDDLVLGNFIFNAFESTPCGNVSN